MKDIDDDFLQYLLNQMHKAYSEYKRDNPEFARVVEEQLEGKTDVEFEAQFKETITHCQSCGEWLQGFDQCDQCGRIHK